MIPQQVHEDPKKASRHQWGSRKNTGGEVMETNFQSIDEGFSEKAGPFPKKNPILLFQKVQGAMGFLPDFGKACRAILNAVMDEVDVENCSLMLRHSTSGDLIICAARGKEDRESIYYPEGSANGKRFKFGEGVAGWVLKEGKAVVVEDAHQDPRFIKTNGLGKKVRSLICYPVREKDQVIGVFNLSHSRKGVFDETSNVVSAYISNHLSAALTSARFFLEIGEINRLLPGVKNDFAQITYGEGKEFSSPPTFVEVGEVTQHHEIFIYASQKMHRIKELIDQVANTDVTVMIQGESGVGKEVVAQSIHLNSLRREKPFVKVNCAALPQELLESELFGYERGAFTGAYRKKLGKFELAHTGTIFLDEISEMSPSLQGKLLQVLQDKEFSRLGGKKDVWVDVRILAATNRKIEELVAQGQFREDLYYRLNVVNITLPPLRERKEEIPIFIEYFLHKFRKKYQKEVPPFSSKIEKVLMNYQWRGNVRELENLIQRYVILEDEKMIMDELTHANMEYSAIKKEKPNILSKAPTSLREVYREATTKAESEAILKALHLTNWNRKKAAKLLHISYKALLYKIKDNGLDKLGFQMTT